jgi:hypothetical protein
MVAQSTPITKSPASISLQKAPRKTVTARWAAAALLSVSIAAGLCLGPVAPALAWIKPDPPNSVNAALVYGMKNQKLNLSTLLGDNWVEGENGALLNVYSPFMMLATKAAKAGLSTKPTKSDLEAARKRFARDVKFYSDPQNRFMVKFAVAFYGDNPEFAKEYSARIVGFGRGKEFNLKPEKQTLDQLADPVSGGASGGKYEAINAYYFAFSDLLDVDEFKLQLTSPNGPPVVFKMRSERLY